MKKKKIIETENTIKENTVQFSDTSDTDAPDFPENISTIPENTDSEPEKKKITFRMLLRNISDFFVSLGIPDMFMIRFVGAFFLISGLNISSIRKSEINAVTQWREFTDEVKFSKTFFLMAAVFIVLTIIYRFMPEKLRVTDQTFAIASILYFDITALWCSNDFYMSAGVMLVSIVFIYNALGKMRRKNIYYKIPWWVCGIIVLAVAALVTFFIALTTVYRHKNFNTSTHDFGLFVQMYYNLSNNLTAVTTCERDEFLSHFYVHASLYLLSSRTCVQAFSETGNSPDSTGCTGNGRNNSYVPHCKKT